MMSRVSRSLSPLVAKHTGRVGKVSPAICLSTLLTVAAVLGLANSVRAAVITWGAPITAAADTDVLTAGSFNYAYDLSNTTQAVNGVTFTGSNSASSLGGNVSLSGLPSNNTSAFGSASGSPWNGLSAAYHNILKGGDYNTGAAATVTLNNLTSGHAYATQFWVNDNRSCCGSRTETITGGGGNTVALNYNNLGNTNGGVGQYTLGGFVADAATQAFTIDGNSSTQINAIQVRDVTGYWSGQTDGNWDNGTANFAAGQSFTDVINSGVGAVHFADTDGLGNAVTNSNVTVQAAGVSIGTVNFDNNAVNYTFQNASGTTGITGATAVVKNGTGTVTLNGANTYTGGTTINANSGTLAAVVNASQNSIGTGSASIGANSTLQLNDTNTSSTVTIGNTFTGSGDLNLNFATGGSARNTYMAGVTGFNGDIQLTSAGATGDKWNANGVNAPNASVNVGDHTQLFVNTSTVTFAGVSIVGTGNTENRGAIRLDSVLTAPVTLLGNATIGGSGSGAINGTISTGVAGTSTLTVGAPNQNAFGADSLKGVISDGTGTLALNVYNQNSGSIFISGSRLNTYSGGTTLLGSSSGTRLVIGSITGTPYGSGPITIGQVATDKAGIYFNSSGTQLANDIVFNTALGTDRPGIRGRNQHHTLRTDHREQLRRLVLHQRHRLVQSDGEDHWSPRPRPRQRLRLDRHRHAQ